MWNRHGHICNTCAAKHPRFRWRGYKARAKKAGIPFELPFEGFMSLWQAPCRYCGTTIETIGLDRLDNNLGYTLENLVPCCPICNQIKGMSTVAEFLARCRRIAKRHPC